MEGDLGILGFAGTYEGRYRNFRSSMQMLDPYLYHDGMLEHRGFFKAFSICGIGNYRSSSRIQGQWEHAGPIQGDFASRAVTVDLKVDGYSSKCLVD